MANAEWRDILDKYEMNLKIDEIKEMVRRRDYQKAAEAADEIDWNKCKSNLWSL